MLRAAVELADEHGVAGLSMRKLAGHLGFEAMSLYNHVRNKDDLLEGMLDVIAQEVELPADDVAWKDGIRTIANSQHASLLNHPWAAALLPHHFPGDARWAISEALLQQLTTGGFTDHLRDVGYHAITLHVAGFTQQQLAYQFTDDRADELMERALTVTGERFPLMLDHIRYHEHWEDIPGERPDEFRFVLDLILEGLDRLRVG